MNVVFSGRFSGSLAPQLFQLVQLAIVEMNARRHLTIWRLDLARREQPSLHNNILYVLRCAGAPHRGALATEFKLPTPRSHQLAYPNVTARAGEMNIRLLNSRWYTTEQLAQILGVDPSTLRRWRTARPVQGPPFVQMSSRVTMYNAGDVELWLLGRRVDPDESAA